MGRNKKTPDLLGDDAPEQLENTAPGGDESQEASDILDDNRAEDNEDIWTWLTQFTPADWTRIFCYVYRWQPYWEVDTTGGKPKYIMKIGEPFTPEQLLNWCGSGVYQLQFNAYSPKGGKNRTLRRQVVDLINPAHPPNLPIGPWLDHPRNASWQWSRPLLEQREFEAAQARAAAMIGTPAHKSQQEQEAKVADEKTIDLVKQTQEKLIELSNPMSQLANVKAILEIARPAKDESGKSEMSLLLQMMREDAKQAREEAAESRKMMMAFLMKGGKREEAAPPKDFMQQLTEFTVAAEALGFKRESGSGGNDSIWMGVLEKIADALPSVVEAFVARPAAPTRRPPIDVQPEQIDLPQQEQEQEEGTGQAQDQAEDPEGQDNMTEAESKLLERFERVLDFVVKRMVRGSKEPDPIAAAKRIQRETLDEFGKGKFIEFRTELGAEKLTAFAMRTPPLKMLLPDEPRVLEFLTAYFDYQG